MYYISNEMSAFWENDFWRIMFGSINVYSSANVDGMATVLKQLKTVMH